MRASTSTVWDPGLEVWIRGPRSGTGYGSRANRRGLDSLKGLRGRSRKIKSRGIPDSICKLFVLIQTDSCLWLLREILPFTLLLILLFLTWLLPRDLFAVNPTHRVDSIEHLFRVLPNLSSFGAPNKRSVITWRCTWLFPFMLSISSPVQPS